MAAYENLNNFIEPQNKELLSKAWSMWQHHVPQNIFSY